MESDLSLINKIKVSRDEDSLVELINRHSGIYTSMVNKYASGPSSSLDKVSFLGDKDYTIYTSALKYDPTKATKFSTHLANETKWKCLNALNKKKKTREFSFDDEDISFPEPFCEDFIEEIDKEESFEIFYKLLNVEKDERVKKIIDMRYNTCNNKVLPWKVIAEKTGLSIQGCIDIHRRFLTKVKKEIFDKPVIINKISCITQ